MHHRAEWLVNMSRRKKNSPSRNTIALGWFAALVIVAGLGFWFKTRPRTEIPSASSVDMRTNGPAPATTPSPVESAAAPPPERLIGGWIRPDGGYLLEIRAVHPDGRAEAAYFNPRSINVSKAEWKRESGQLRLFVELRDVNYPGSTYRVTLAPDGDHLIGNYHQAALGQDFEIQFEREK